MDRVKTSSGKDKKNSNIDDSKVATKFSVKSHTAYNARLQAAKDKINKTSVKSQRKMNDEAIENETYIPLYHLQSTYNHKILSTNDQKSMSFTTYCRQYEIIRRNQFTSHWDFLVSCLGATVGYGNIWRFPGLAFLHGGGTFFIPYLTCLILVGLPFVSLEMFIGQLSGVGIARTLGLIAPVFAGVGWGMIVLSFFLSLQYSMLLSYCIFYFFASFKNKLPWVFCDNDWNSNYCLSTYDLEQCQGGMNCTIDLLDQNSSGRFLPTEEFLYSYVLEYKPSEDEQNTVSLKLAVPLFGTWLTVFACLLFGLKVTSKVTYVTATFPYLGLLILFFRSITLKGAGEGVSLFFTPNFTNIFSPYIWVDALLHTIYTLNTGFGGLTAMASYNPFHNNCQK